MGNSQATLRSLSRVFPRSIELARINARSCSAALPAAYNIEIEPKTLSFVRSRQNPIMPNGWSIALRGMPGSDASGSAGLTGAVDTHLGRIAVASLLSGVLGVAANQSENDHSNRLTQSVGDAAAQQAAQTGSHIVDRELSVRPTLRVHAGERVRVLVSLDLVFRPYSQ